MALVLQNVIDYSRLASHEKVPAIVVFGTIRTQMTNDIILNGCDAMLS